MSKRVDKMDFALVVNIGTAMSDEDWEQVCEERVFLRARKKKTEKKKVAPLTQG